MQKKEVFAKISNLYILATWWCKPLIFQTEIILFNKSNSLKYFKSKKSGCKDIGIRMTQFLCNNNTKSIDNEQGA